MASRGTLVLLVAFALVAGGLMEAVKGEESFVRRRLAGHPLGASAVVVPVPPLSCPITCGGLFNPLFPNCCQNTVVPGLPPVYFCANNQIDILNCGICGNSCIASGLTLGDACCAGTCTNTLTDANNCGSCGFKCPALDVCRGGLCNYAG